MANLKTITITGNEYVDLATASGITFVNGNKYQIQAFDTTFIREGATDEGFILEAGKTITLDYKGATVYVKPTLNSTRINIAE